MIKAIIFDLDGTLLDTSQDITNSINLTLKSLNKELLPQEKAISHTGCGIKKFVYECVRPQDDAEAQ